MKLDRLPLGHTTFSPAEVERGQPFQLAGITALDLGPKLLKVAFRKGHVDTVP